MKIDAVMIFFKSGGVFMYPIAFIGCIAFAVVIERLIMTLWYNKGISSDITAFSEQIDDAAIEKLQASSSVLGSTLHNALSGYQEMNIDKLDFEELVSISAINSIRLLSRRTVIISTFANVATLLGLLGTIMGLIQSFATVAQTSGGDKSALLSGAVSTAMNTTAFGLMVAIPLLLLYAFIDNKSNKAIENLEAGCAIVTNKLYAKKVKA